MTYEERQILEALLEDRELQHLYFHDAGFHYEMEHLVQVTLPALVDGLVVRAKGGGAARAAEVERLVKMHPSTQSIPPELRAQFSPDEEPDDAA